MLRFDIKWFSTRVFVRCVLLHKFILPLSQHFLPVIHFPSAPVSCQTVHCTPIEYSKLPLCLQLLCVSADQRELSFLGSLLDDGVACGIADGVLCPDTKQPFLISPSASLLSTPRIPLSISRASSQSSIASLSSSRSLSQSLPPRPATSKPKAFSQAFASLAHQPTPSASSHPFSPYTTGKIVISPYFKTAVDSQRSQSDSKLAAGMAKISTISDLAKLSCESSDAQEEGVYDLYHLDALCYDAQVQSNPRHKPSSTPSPLTVESAMEREVSNPSPSPSPPPPPPKASPTLSLETFSYVEKDSSESVRSSTSRPTSSLSRSLSPTGVGGVGHGDWREGGSAVKKQKKVVANMTTKVRLTHRSKHVIARMYALLILRSLSTCVWGKCTGLVAQTAWMAVAAHCQGGGAIFPIDAVFIVSVLADLVESLQHNHCHDDYVLVLLAMLGGVRRGSDGRLPAPL